MCLSFLSKWPETSVALMETPAAENPGSQEFYHIIEPVNCLPPSSGKWEIKAARDPFSSLVIFTCSARLSPRRITVQPFLSQSSLVNCFSDL